MKKLLLLFAGLCFATIGNSQITITRNDIVNAGDSLFLYLDTVPNNTIISPGETGNQTWDFTNLEEHDIDSIFLLHPYETEYFSEFPSSNVAAFVVKDDMYVYLTKNETGLYQNGMVGDLTDNGEIDTIINSNSEAMIFTPLNYNDMTLDTVKRELVLGNMKVIQTIHVKDTIDAYGDITLSSGTFSSLRKFGQSIQIDSIYTYSGVDWVFVQKNIDTTYEYEWWTNDAKAKFFICSFGYDIVEDTITSDISYLKEVRFSDIKEVALSTNTLIYPNPNNGVFTIKSNVNQIDFVEILDYTGKIVNILAPKNNIFEVDISGKSKGLYFIRINSGERDELYKVILK